MAVILAQVVQSESRKLIIVIAKMSAVITKLFWEIILGDKGLNSRLCIVDVWVGKLDRHSYSRGNTPRVYR